MAISGYCELLLLEMAAEDPLRKEVVGIQNATIGAAVRTKQLLAFSTKQFVDPKVTDLNAVLANMNKMLRRLIGEHIELHASLAADLWKIKADQSQIEQIILNLTITARDAMPDGGQLVIETSNVTLDEKYSEDHLDVQPGEYVLLTVADTGSGMSQKTRAHIFEPFFTTKEKGKGTGLGLPTVYGIVKQSGGFIEVESELGHGTRFQIYFPRCEQPFAERDRF